MTDLLIAVKLNILPLMLGVVSIMFLLLTIRSWKKKREAGVIAFGLSCVLLIASTIFTYNFSGRDKVSKFRNDYPLDVQVQVIVDREEMNAHYDELSEEEIQIFELSKETFSDAFITRTSNNVLIVKVGDTEVTLYEPKDGKTSNEWILILNKDYYLPIADDTA